MNINHMHQIHHELDTWGRTLNYIQQENIHLKTRLAQIIKNGIDDRLLEQVEYFQSQFLNKDAIIALLRQDIAKELKLNGEMADEQNQLKHEKLRRDMELMENEFNRLKFDFNSYLTESL